MREEWKRAPRNCPRKKRMSGHRDIRRPRYALLKSQNEASQKRPKMGASPGLREKSRAHPHLDPANEMEQGWRREEP